MSPGARSNPSRGGVQYPGSIAQRSTDARRRAKAPGAALEVTGPK
jgi:hypothetical protein